MTSNYTDSVSDLDFIPKDKMPKINLKDQEQILQSFRGSRWLLLKPAVISVVAIWIPLYFFFGYGLYPKFVLLAVIWILIWIGYFNRKFTPWILKHYIITNQRVIIVFYENIFKRNVLETPLDRILNVSYKNTGFLSSFMNFGNVEIQAVGLAEIMKSLNLENIAQPEVIKDYLWQIHEHYRATHPDAFKTELAVSRIATQKPIDAEEGREQEE